ncbi:hypothetical protein BBJ28_00004828 [Nothophytophthora sp. Chile5]|nr:hypothetical protein BBJ28_00004828 [Nothophytophthora sp. Chile5]
MDALWDFVTEFDLVTLEDEVIRADTAVKVLSTSFEYLLESFKPDVDTETESSDGDEAEEAIASRPPQNNDEAAFERNRQHAYDKKSRDKKKVPHFLTRLAAIDAFMEGVKLLNAMLEGRLESSYTARDKLRAARVDFYSLRQARDADVFIQPELLGCCEDKVRSCQVDAENQLLQNRSAMACAEKWVEGWALQTRKHKFFLRSWAAEIRLAMGRMEQVGTQLRAASDELVMCVSGECM